MGKFMPESPIFLLMVKTHGKSGVDFPTKTNPVNYPLVNVYIANWKDPPFFLWENSLFLWPCSSSQTVKLPVNYRSSSYWESPIVTPGDHPDPGVEPTSWRPRPVCPALGCSVCGFLRGVFWSFSRMESMETWWIFWMVAKSCTWWEIIRYL